MRYHEVCVMWWRNRSFPALTQYTPIHTYSISPPIPPLTHPFMHLYNLFKLYFLSWIPSQAQGHLKMMYSSQIGTVTSYGGSGFTAFRGLHEVKTTSTAQVSDTRRY